MKAAFQYLDVWYFFFFTQEDESIVLQFTPKDWIKTSPEKIIGDFSDTLLENVLRDKLEKDNKIIRESIVLKAINWPLDYENFVSLETENTSEKNQIDFDKDIDDILKDIQNDPDLKIDEEEVEKILEDMKVEIESKNEKPLVDIDMDAIKNIKENFKQWNK